MRLSVRRSRTSPPPVSTCALSSPIISDRIGFPAPVFPLSLNYLDKSCRPCNAALGLFQTISLSGSDGKERFRNHRSAAAGRGSCTRWGFHPFPQDARRHSDQERKHITADSSMGSSGSSTPCRVSNENDSRASRGIAPGKSESDVVLHSSAAGAPSIER